MSLKLIRHLFVSVLLLLTAGKAPAGSLRTAGIFSDHMVLQRDMEIPVWGWAEPGEKVGTYRGEDGSGVKLETGERIDGVEIVVEEVW